MNKINSKTSTKVTSIATAAVNLKPPEGWKLNGEHGYMASDSTPVGRLVRLADVVVWLMDRRPLPCSMAVEELCTVIESAAPDALYLVQPGRFALPVTPSDCFTGVPETRSFWEGPAPAPATGECGLAGALKYMRWSWGSNASPGMGNHFGQELLDPLAMHLTKAAELWGYGFVDYTAAQAPAFQPPAEWMPETQFGTMRWCEGPAGMVVRLFDVLRWLQETDARRLARPGAVEALCDSLTPDAMQWLYQVAPGKYASRLPPDWEFGYPSPTSVVAQEPVAGGVRYRVRRSSTTGRRMELLPPATASRRHVDTCEPGFPALLKALRDWPLRVMPAGASGDVLDYQGRGESPLVRVAIRLDKAAALWGYGRLLDAVIQTTTQQPAGEEWTGERLKAKREQLKREGVRDYTQRLVKLSGITERDVRRRIAEFENPSVFSGIVATLRVKSGKKSR